MCNVENYILRHDVEKLLVSEAVFGKAYDARNKDWVKFLYQGLSHYYRRRVDFVLVAKIVAGLGYVNIFDADYYDKYTIPKESWLKSQFVLKTDAEVILSEMYWFLMKIGLEIMNKETAEVSCNINYY